MEPFSRSEFCKLGARYVKDFAALKRFPYVDGAAVRRFQIAQIENLVRVAYRDTEHYRKIYDDAGFVPDSLSGWDVFSTIPTTSKRDVLDRGLRYYSSSATSAKGVRRSRSSGSSGEVLNIYADIDRWIASALLMLRMYRGSFKFGPFTRGTIIYTSPYPFHYSHPPFGLSYVSTLESPRAMLAKLQAARPRFIISYPSSLMELADNFPAECAELNVQAIAINSEQTSELQRKALAQSFGCPVFDEYSTEELVLGAFQCRNGTYHLQEGVSYLEILEVERDVTVPDGTVGEIVGTCLVNNVTPFIRYRQGDLGAISSVNCSCGMRGRALTNISGRKNSSFILGNGATISSGRLLDWTYELITTHALPLRQFQLTQVELDRIEALLVVDGAGGGDIDRFVEKSFRAEFGEEFTVAAKVVPQIPKTPAGKHIPIRSLVAAGRA